jgi:hypothetical protein
VAAAIGDGPAVALSGRPTHVIRYNVEIVRKPSAQRPKLRGRFLRKTGGNTARHTVRYSAGSRVVGKLRMWSLSSRLTMLCAGAALVAGCTASAATSPIVRRPVESAHSVYSPSVLNALNDALRSPALIAVDYRTGALEYWPIRPTGGEHPRTLTRPLGLSGLPNMVANGHVVAITNANPPEVIVYDLKTKSESILPDPHGVPIDIAMDKNATLYVVNLTKSSSNVTVYPAGSTPSVLACQYMTDGVAIAVDNEGDIFVNGYGPANFTGVVEIPNGPNGPQPQNCTKLALKPELGYVAGLAIDPKTDDLIVLDNPSFCAGGSEGRMTIYPKPYQRSTGHARVIGSNCSGWLRLNATSTVVFVEDQSIGGATTFILQRTYPDGRHLGTFTRGNPVGFTTIPNTLPN